MAQLEAGPGARVVLLGDAALHPLSTEPQPGSWGFFFWYNLEFCGAQRAAGTAVTP